KREHDGETGGLGLGFGDLYDQEDAFGNGGKYGAKVEGNLTKFRKEMQLTSLAPPLSESQSKAATQLCNHPINLLKKLDEATATEIGKLATSQSAMVEALRKVRGSGVSNLQISEFCGCYLRVIETLLGGDGSKPVVRDLSDDVDHGTPSSLSTSIVNAMYREKVI